MHVENFAVTEDDAVFHFTLLYYRVVTNCREWADVCILDYAVLADDHGASYNTLNNLCALPDNDLPRNG